MVDPLGHLLGHKIAGSLLHGDLALDGVGHVMAIPSQAALVVPVEEVHLRASGPHVRMQSDELQERPSSALLDADDQRVRQMSRWPESLLPEQLILGSSIQAAGYGLSWRSTGGYGAGGIGATGICGAATVSRFTALIAGRGGECQEVAEIALGKWRILIYFII